MNESLLTSLTMNNHHPYTLLSIQPSSADSTAMDTSYRDTDREFIIQKQPQLALSLPEPDINRFLSSDQSPLPSWNLDYFETVDVGLGPEAEDSVVHIPKTFNNRYVKRGDCIWGAWFFFNFYFKPMLSEKPRGKITRDGKGMYLFNMSDLNVDVFLVQHDMENMYMWVFKERPENALRKMQLQNYMNGHCRLGDPKFPYSAEKGFVRSHRMQRKQYRGMSNPQCIHGIELVRLPNLSVVTEDDLKKWMVLTGRDLNFSIPVDASDFGSWRNHQPSTDFEHVGSLPLLKHKVHPHSKTVINGSGLNLSTQPLNHDVVDFSSQFNKRRKDLFNQSIDEDCCLVANCYSDRPPDMGINPSVPSWINEFTGLMRHVYGPVTAAKTIYEDGESYLIMVSLPLSDQQRVKVYWRNNLTHGIVKISCMSTGRMPFLKRLDRTFKLSDPSPEHCPPGEFVREIQLATRIPENANLEAYYDETGTVLEIIVPKHGIGPEEHEVHVSMRPPHLGTTEHELIST
ncbi:hypothetical protein IEQ34_002339 [Dendrobium chrysotoxum]|uniref:Uncharacterized protein n=1 Tax=Dendrobium chrysotoxum TaxID=161865 RepID=A0AAV7HJL7_DENCH|nr:hypothetical protein IEQ34_002339 [Dendrobium chrysotoxum]